MREEKIKYIDEFVLKHGEDILKEVLKNVKDVLKMIEEEGYEKFRANRYYVYTTDELEYFKKKLTKKLNLLKKREED